MNRVKKPDFVIIGAMKSATTYLQERLDCQRGIYTSDPKEPNFFSDDALYKKDQEWYWNLFKQADDDQIIGEASTHYTKLPRYPKTAERLKQHIPDAKLIYVMRHPLDRLVSHYIHNWTMGFVKKSTSLNEAVESYKNFVNYGCYYMQLQPWIELFGKENILPVFFDRLMSHPDREVVRACEFIGLKDQPIFDIEKGGSNVSAERVRKIPLQSLVIDSKLARFLRQSLIPKTMRTKLRERLKYKGRPELNTELRQKIEKVFDEDLGKLGGLMGIELNCENFKDVTAEKELDWCERKTNSSFSETNYG